MTYEKLMNSLLSHFDKGECNGWVLTDDSCLQAYKEILDEQGRCEGYRFIMLSEAPMSEEWCLFYEEQYLFDEYTPDDLWACGKFYYSDRKEFDNLPDYVKYECVFEEKGHPTVYQCSDAFGWYLDNLNF